MLEDPHAGCLELRFGRPVRLSPGGEGALEDYARALTGARHAEAVPSASDPACVAGLHLCVPEGGPSEEQRRDLEAFALEMETPGAGPGLGWN